jgi:hypothetical protein
MEIIIVLFVALGFVGVSTMPETKKDNKVIKSRQTRLIEQSREMVYDTQVIKEWDE